MNSSRNNKSAFGRNLPAGKVRGLLNPTDIRPLPGAPSFIKGMVELEGQWIPVLDMGRAVSEDQPFVVVVENSIDGENSLFGIVADEFEEFLSAGELTPGNMHNTPADFPYSDVTASVGGLVDDICELLRYQALLAAMGLEGSSVGRA